MDNLAINLKQKYPDISREDLENLIKIEKELERQGKELQSKLESHHATV